ncbi:hypothetical protein PFLG_01518 [Plasmodium falciparum RAJ116]|uniref:Uncharacterized protein n=1 Tax=Plasmodium falciparum RAJ116 TaxID=580058 RepID=A0A0L0CVZ7_PLAFA|nr:hypothetical protein PFLG_01518 [Plasmodium falciparum RAJ116]
MSNILEEKYKELSTYEIDKNINKIKIEDLEKDKENILLTKNEEINNLKEEYKMVQQHLEDTNVLYEKQKLAIDTITKEKNNIINECDKIKNKNKKLNNKLKENQNNYEHTLNNIKKENQQIIEREKKNFTQKVESLEHAFKQSYNQLKDQNENLQQQIKQLKNVNQGY